VCEESFIMRTHSTPDERGYRTRPTPPARLVRLVPWVLGSCPTRTESAAGVTSRAKSTKERTMATNPKLLLPKTLWLGTIGVATMLLGWTPSCKAQEVSPAHFTDTGVEDVYPAKKLLAKKPAKVYIATHSIQAKPCNQAIDRKQNTHRAARKRNVVSAPSI